MNDLMIFNNPEFGEIRTVEISGEPWLVGRDVAQVLGYAKPENAIATHVDDEDKTTTLIQGTGSNYKSKVVLINESGLYSLVLSSKLPGAKKFKRWVTSEVLPSIRKMEPVPNFFISVYKDDYKSLTLDLEKKNSQEKRELDAELISKILRDVIRSK